MRNFICTARTAVLLLFPVFVSSRILAQTAAIKGFVKGPAGEPVQYANVLLVKAPDSSLVKGTISDVSGKYAFDNIAKGQYRVSASFAGKEQVYTAVFEITQDKNEIVPAVLYLSNTDVQLKDVTVIAKRPMFEQKIDRMVINVKNSITNVGGTALDVLEKSPGVTVNRQNNSIAVNGKNGVTVMINGKIVYMPMTALIQLLEGTSTGNIEKIELITSPPAKYDAAGNGGFINIVLINNPYSGFSGSYFLSAGYGNRERGSAGINFNYRSDRVNLYGNYTFNHDTYIQPIRYFTHYTTANSAITNSSFSDRDAVFDVHNSRIGIDYQLDTATIIGALVGGYDSRWTMSTNNGATISRNNITDTSINTFGQEINHWQNIMANLNFQHTFKPGELLFVDANYIYYKDNNPNTYANDYYNGSKQFMYHEDVRSGKVTPIDFRVLSADYTTSLNRKITMEAGAKIALSKFTNDVSVDNLKQGTWVSDASLSANYLLKENIGAAYTSFTINPNSKLLVKAGLRYEYTTSDLSTVQAGTILNRKYGELFPTFYVSQKFDDGGSASLSYSRRITRPTFNDLAPFTIFFDPKTFFTGNPGLQPAIANTIQASYSFKSYILSVSYTHEVNTIGDFVFQSKGIDTITNSLYLSPENFRYEKYLTANLSLPFSISKCWSTQNNIGGGWNKISAMSGNVPVKFQFYNYSLTSTQRFSLPADFFFELTGVYSSPGYFGTAKARPMYRLDAGLQKKFNNKKDALSLTGADIFNSGGYYKYRENLPTGAFISANFNYGLVAYKLTYTHNFGNKALKDKRERSTGAEDELKRVRN